MTMAAVSAAGVEGTQATDLRITTVARALQPGEVVRVEVTCRCGSMVPRVMTPSGELALFRVSPESVTVSQWQGLLGLDLDVPAGPWPITVYGAEATAPPQTITLVVKEKAFATRQLRVAPNFVEPSVAEVERITREAATLDALFRTSTPRAWRGPFVAPVAARATSNFGTRSVYNGEPRSPHAGVDFSSPTGTRIVAPGDGRVVLVDDLFFTGKTVVIDHGLGLVSLFAHLSSTAVRVSDVVEGGTLVGQVGATGRATGPHLHWGVRLNGARVDPLSLLVATRADTRQASPPRARVPAK